MTLLTNNRGGLGDSTQQQPPGNQIFSLSQTYSAAGPAQSAAGFTVSRLREQPAEKSKSKYFTEIFLSALILFSTAISALFLTGQSLRLDEAQSLWQSSRSPLGILNIISQDVHVPFYPLLLHFWQLLFGNDISQVRILSLLLFLAAIPATYFLGKKAFNSGVGLFGALLMSISPFLNWYGNEIRMYSLMTLLTILNQYYFISLLKAGEDENLPKAEVIKAWVGFGITAVFGIYSHYFFWLVLLTPALFFIFYKKHFPAKSLRNFALLVILLALAIAPWLFFVWRTGLIGNSTPFLGQPTTINLFNTFSQFIFGFQDDHLNSLLLSLWPITVLFGFLFMRKQEKIPAAASYFFISTFLPLLVTFIFSILVKPVFITRYFIFTIPSLYLFLAWFLATYPKKIAAGLKTALVLGMLLTLVTQLQKADTPVKENYRQAAEYLSGQTKPKDIVLVSAPFIIYPVEYYYRGAAGLSTMPVWDRFKSGPIPPFNPEQIAKEMAEIGKSHEKAYLLLGYDQGYEDDLKNYFDSHYQKLEEKNFSAGLNLYVYKLRYENFSLFDDILNDRYRNVNTSQTIE